MDRPAFTAAAGDLSQMLRHNHCSDPIPFASQVKQKIECLNVAGLCDPRKRNWYDVDLDDLIVSAEKLELSAEEVRRFVQTAGWAQTAVKLQKYRPQQLTIQLAGDESTLADEPVGELVGASPA